MGICRRRLWRSAPWSVVGCVVAAHWSLAVAQEHPYLDHPMEVGYDIGVPVRDGIHLSADIYRPMDDGRHPTIFQLTPYNNNSQRTMDQAWGSVQRGYAYVVVDVRGRYDSEGTFYAWKSKYGGLTVSDAKRLKALEDENGRLKKLLAEQMLDAAAMRELLAKKW